MSNIHDKKLRKRKMNGKTLALFAVVFIAGLLIGGYAIGPFVVPPPEPGLGDLYPEDSAWRTGSLRIVGSTTVLPIANACAIAFMNVYTETAITVEGGGSGRGYSEIISGLTDIGDASREPQHKELDSAAQAGVTMVLHEVALDGIAVIINPSVANALDLNLETIAKIFAGEYATWADAKAGLPDHEIIIFSREQGSGTRGTFEELCLMKFNKELTTGASEVPSNPAMRQSVEQTDYSVGYVGMGFLTGDIVVINVAAEAGDTYYAPTPENVKLGIYPVSRYLYMVTNGIPESGSLIDRFIDFVKSPDGQAVAEAEGFVALYPTA